MSAVANLVPEGGNEAGKESQWKGKASTTIPPLDFSTLPFDPITATAESLQQQLHNGSLTCVDLVETYLKVISTYNHKVHAVIQVAPKAQLLERAKQLDQERKDGKAKSGIHGIPILVKDNIDTDPKLGLGTTAGSFALLHSRPKGNAPLVEGLIEAGAIILGINDEFLRSAVAKVWSDEETTQAVEHARKIGRDEGIDHTLSTFGVDVILGPADSDMVDIISGSGYPIATLPLTTSKRNGRPFGLAVMAKAWQEDLLIKVMSAWEATMPARPVPDLNALKF